MAEVPTGNFVPTTTPTAIPDNMQQIDATPDAFGAQIAESRAKIGAGLMQVSDDASQAGLDRQNLLNQTASDAAVNNYMNGARTLLYGDPSDPSKPGFMSLRGQDAINAAPATQQALVNLQSSLGSNLNPIARQQYDQESRRYQNQDVGALAQKTDQETQQFQAQTADATIANATNAAAQNAGDPTALAYGLGKVQATVQQQAAVLGWNPEQVQAAMTMQSGAYLKTIAATIATSNPLGAQQFLDANRGHMTAEDYTSMSEVLRPRVNDAVGQSVGLGIINNPTGSIVTLPNSVSVDTLYNSVQGVESGHQQFDPKTGQPMTSGVGGADAPVGISQIKPSTAQGVAASVGLPYDPNRLATDANYNATLGKEYLQQQMDAFKDPNLALAAYDAGPGTVQAAIRTYGDPRTGAISMPDFISKLPPETQQYVSRIAAENGGQSPDGAAASGAVPSYQVPDLNSQLNEVMVRTAGMDPAVQQKALSVVKANFDRVQAVNTTARTQIEATLNDTSARFLSGDATPLIPTDQINRLYPPEAAQALISELSIDRQAGQAMTALRWGSPADNQATLAMFTNPNAVQAIRASKDGVTGPGVVTPPGVTPGPDDIGTSRATVPPAVAPVATAPEGPDQAAFRQRLADKLTAQLQQRDAALASDPAGYIAADPALSKLAAAANAQGATAQDMQAYTQASLAEQQRLGVQNPRILSQYQVTGLSQKLATLDPSKSDVGSALDQMAGQFGSYWPQVFGELVKYGKLDPNYQTLAAMDQPAQLQARQDFQRSLQVGSIKDIQGASDPQVIKNVDTQLQNDSVTGTLADFRQTTAGQSGGIALMNNVTDSVKRLAYYYVSQGQSATQAVQNATDGILNDKYDFDGTMRVPKGMLPTVNAATATILSGLKPGDLLPVSGARGLTDEDNQNIIYQSAKQSGTWVPNADDSGLVLMRPLRNGGMLPVKLSNGQPVQLKFSDAPALAAQSPSPSGMENEAQALNGL